MGKRRDPFLGSDKPYRKSRQTIISFSAKNTNQSATIAIGTNTRIDNTNHSTTNQSSATNHNNTNHSTTTNNNTMNNNNVKNVQIIKKIKFKDFIICGITLKFPFHPYPSQFQVMSNLINCLKNSSNGIFESPTGTGKTLSILISSISWQQNEKSKIIAAQNHANDLLKNRINDLSLPKTNGISDRNATSHNLLFSTPTPTPTDSNFKVPKIFIASRTHRQLEQMVLELRNKTNLVPKMAIIGSREQLCIDPETSSKSNKNEECAKKIEFKSCLYFENSKTLASIKRAQNEIFDIEDLVKEGKEMGGCPYYAAKSLCENADVIFTPYNYIIDPQSCPAEISLAGNILIIDEAHNVESCATDAASIQVQETDLTFAISDLQTFAIATKSNTDDLKYILAWFSQWIVNHMYDQLSIGELDKFMKLWSGQEAVSMITQGGIEPSSIMKCKIDFERFTSGVSSSKDADAKLKPSTKTTVSKILMVLEFLLINGYQSDYKMVLTKNNREKSAGVGPELGVEFWCLNSGVIFKELGKKCRSLILTSGTLAPISGYALELGIPFTQRVEAHHVVGQHQLWAGVVPCSPSGKNLKCTSRNLELPDFQIQLGLTIVELIKVIPNGCLVFLPSFPCLDLLIKRWKVSGTVWSELQKHKTLFIERRDSVNLEKFLCQYDQAAQSQSGALMFCVYRAKMSEGIDFANEKARGVICVGIPFPSLKSPKLNEMKIYHNSYSKEKNLMDGDSWYDTQAFRALNQALGRCIRHQNDYGSVILLDSRFKTTSRYQKLVPKWFQKFLTIHHLLPDVTHSLATFFSKIDEMEKVEKLKRGDDALNDEEPEQHQETLLNKESETPSCQENQIEGTLEETTEGHHVSDNDCSLEEGVPSIQDEQSPPSEHGKKLLRGTSEVFVPESPHPRFLPYFVKENTDTQRPLPDVVKENTDTQSYHWTCSSCATPLVTSVLLEFVKNGPKYLYTLSQESELCDLGQFDAKLISDQSGCVIQSHADGLCEENICYFSVNCKKCGSMVGSFLQGYAPRMPFIPKQYHYLLSHLLFFSSKTAFGTFELGLEHYSESPRLDYRSYSDEFSPIDLDALEN